MEFCPPHQIFDLLNSPHTHTHRAGASGCCLCPTWSVGLSAVWRVGNVYSRGWDVTPEAWISFPTPLLPQGELLPFFPGSKITFIILSVSQILLFLLFPRFFPKSHFSLGILLIPEVFPQIPLFLGNSAYSQGFPPHHPLPVAEPMGNSYNLPSLHTLGFVFQPHHHRAHELSCCFRGKKRDEMEKETHERSWRCSPSSFPAGIALGWEGA